MHAASVTLLSLAMTGAACFSAPVVDAAAPFVLAALVVFVGLPHGAADHRFARPFFESVLGRTWLPVFLLGYLAVGGIVVVGWLAAPAITIVLFFLASAWHFGVEEPRLVRPPQWLRPLLRFARGGVVIWTPVAFRGDEVAAILATISPASASLQIETAMGVLSVLSPVMLSLAVAALGLQSLAAAAGSGLKRRVLAIDAALQASFLALLIAASPVVGFIVYFCAWHSARGLRRLRRELGESWRQLAASLAPMTLATVALATAGAWLLLGSPSLEATLLRSTFVGLSAVAVPHLALHAFVPSSAATGSATGDVPVVLRGQA